MRIIAQKHTQARQKAEQAPNERKPSPELVWQESVVRPISYIFRAHLARFFLRDDSQLTHLLAQFGVGVSKYLVSAWESDPGRLQNCGFFSHNN